MYLWSPLKRSKSDHLDGRDLRRVSPLARRPTVTERRTGQNPESPEFEWNSVLFRSVPVGLEVARSCGTQQPCFAAPPPAGTKNALQEAMASQPACQPAPAPWPVIQTNSSRSYFGPRPGPFLCVVRERGTTSRSAVSALQPCPRHRTVRRDRHPAYQSAPTILLTNQLR